MKSVTAKLNCTPKHAALPMFAVWRNAIIKMAPALGD
jgi:hypothetical protein